MALKVGLFSLEQPGFMLSNAPRLHRFECSQKISPPDPPYFQSFFLWTIPMPDASVYNTINPNKECSQTFLLSLFYLQFMLIWGKETCSKRTDWIRLHEIFVTATQRQGCTLADFRHRPDRQVRPQSEPARTLLNWPNLLVIISQRIEDILLCSLIFSFFVLLYMYVYAHRPTKSKENTAVKPRTK